jgi:ATP-binding cassette, subfamily C (CFTR/MRP), member 1
LANVACLLNENQISFAILAILQCVNLALWTKSLTLRTRASTAAATLNLAATVALSYLSYLEHVRSIQPSALINVYLLFTLPLDFAQVRTLWLRHSDVALASTYTATSAIKAGLLILEAIEKGRILLPSYQSTSPEAKSGVYSRSVFWWLNPLFLMGHRTVLSNDSLLDIDDALATDQVYARFQHQWLRRRSSIRLRTLNTDIFRIELWQEICASRGHGAISSHPIGGYCCA